MNETFAGRLHPGLTLLESGLALVLLLALVAPATARAGELTLDRTSFEVPVDATAVPTVFRVQATNGTSHALVLEGSAHSPCVTVKTSDEPLQPGESREIIVTFDPDQWTGSSIYRPRIFSDARSYSVPDGEYITAYRKEIELRLHVGFERPIVVTPAFITWGDATGPRTVRVVSKDPARKLVAVEATDPAIQPRVREVAPGEYEV